MTKEVIHIAGIQNRVGTFHHVVKANGFLFLSSQLSCDVRTGQIIPGSIEEQTRRAMDNIKFLIESCGGKMEDIVTVRIYMKKKEHREKINNIYAEYFTEGTQPAKVSLIAPSPLPGIDVEIETTAIAR